MLAEELAERGIASVRYDKRGVAESAKAAVSEADLRFEMFIDDARSWIDQISADERFGSVIVLGHSIGGLIGNVVAQDDDVDGLISLAGSGETLGEAIRRQIRAQSEELYIQTDSIASILENGGEVDDVPGLLMTVFRPALQPYLRSVFQYDPVEEIRKVDKPVLILNGTTDLQIRVKDAEMLHQAAPNAELKIIEGMNHVLKDAPADRMANLMTYYNSDLPLSDGLVDSIVSFINKIVQ